MAHYRLRDVRTRHAAAVEELAPLANSLLVYTPLALTDIPALANDVAELRRLYLTARGHLRDMFGDEAIERLGFGGTSRRAYRRPSSGQAAIVKGANIVVDLWTLLVSALRTGTVGGERRG